MTFLYNLLLILGAPLWVPWMLRRSGRRAESVNWKERLGYAPKLGGAEKRIWIHAVSVGEVVACLPILRELRQGERVTIILSVTTSSGHQTAREQATGLYDHLIYLPLDLPWMTRRAMLRVRPNVLAIMETELWLNLLRSAKQVGATTMLLNGRISDRSFPRSLKVRRFYATLFESVDLSLMQSAIDAERVQALGAKATQIVGNVKFDQAQDGVDADPDVWRSALGLGSDRPVIVIGSARAEEFAGLVDALRPLLGAAQIIVAPRHVDRLPELLAACAGIPLTRRSKDEKMPPDGVLILDTYGELSSIYAVADIVVVGGGFADLGGQNIIQPLAHGKPVIHGPHMQNFRDVAALATRANASVSCELPALTEVLQSLMANSDERTRMGVAAQALVSANLGAAARYAHVIRENL